LDLVLVAAGVASWFTPYQHMYDGMRVCAMRDVTLIGSRVHIEDLDNGRHSSCVVIGTGPFVAGRVIDVSPLVRDDLGMRFSGLAHVRVYFIDRRKP
jgi:rare lipoprotein A (peptidoglycan hydrolase)